RHYYHQIVQSHPVHTRLLHTVGYHDGVLTEKTYRAIGMPDGLGTLRPPMQRQPASQQESLVVPGVSHLEVWYLVSRACNRGMASAATTQAHPRTSPYTKRAICSAPRDSRWG